MKFSDIPVKAASAAGNKVFNIPPRVINTTIMSG